MAILDFKSREEMQSYQCAKEKKLNTKNYNILSPGNPLGDQMSNFAPFHIAAHNDKPKVLTILCI